MLFAEKAREAGLSGWDETYNKNSESEDFWTNKELEHIFDIAYDLSDISHDKKTIESHPQEFKGMIKIKDFSTRYQKNENYSVSLTLIPNIYVTKKGLITL